MTAPRRSLLRPLLSMLAALSITATITEAAGAGGEPERRLVNDRCPVMEDEPASPVYEVQFRGVAVRFCCSDCQEKFAAKPTSYLSHLPQLSADTLQPAAFDAQQHARAEWAASRVDRWRRPVLLAVAGLIAGLLVLRIVRRNRLAHANAGALSALHSGEGLHPATGPRLPE